MVFWHVSLALENLRQDMKGPVDRCGSESDHDVAGRKFEPLTFVYQHEAQVIPRGVLLVHFAEGGREVETT